MEFLRITEILLRRKWCVLAVFFLFVFIFTALAFLIPVSYQTSAKLFIQSSSAFSSLMSELDMPENNTTGSSDEDLFETKTALAQIRPLLDELISNLQLKDRDGEPMEPDDLIKSGLSTKIFLRPSVTVEQNDDAAILEISATSSDPAQSAAISNKLAELYLNYNVERAQEEVIAVKKFLNKKLELLHDNYNTSFAELTEFKIHEHATDLETEQENTILRLHDLTTSYEDSQQSIALLNKEIQQTEQELRKVRKYRKEIKEFAKNDQKSTLQSELDKLLVQLASKRIVYQKEHPEYRQIEKEFEAVQKLIKKSADIVLNGETLAIAPVYDSLSSQLVSMHIEREVELKKSILLQDNIAEYEKKLAAFPEKLAELTKLELALSADKDIYERFLNYLNKVQLAEAVALSDARIVELAETPEKQNFPKKTIMYLLGISLGLFWGPMIAFFFEYIDTTIHSPKDIRHIDPFSILGSIPKARCLKSEQLLTRHRGNAKSSDDTFSEYYRTIRHNLQFASVNKDIKTILVTSSGIGEGKSSFAANFALSCAKANKKVLLADLNLRRPAVHRYFSLECTNGIVDLVKNEVNIQAAVFETAVPGLDILPVGHIKENFGDIIESDNLRQLLHNFKRHYDTIIIDTPSLNSTSDALIIASMTDYLVYIIECHRTQLADIEHTYHRLQQAGIQRVGCVANKYHNNKLLCGNRTFQSGGVSCG